MALTDQSEYTLPVTLATFAIGQTDTTGEPGTGRWYAVASLPGAETGPGPLSDPVAATPRAAPAAPVTARVDPAGSARTLNRMWHMIGSERLSQLYTPRVGEEFAEALRLAVFWTGTRDEYFRLYDLAASAAKAVDERLPVGGPATAVAD